MDTTASKAFPSSTTSSTTSGDALSRGVNQVGETLHGAVDKVAQPARDAVDSAANGAHAAVDKLAMGANSLEDRARDLARVPLKALDYSKAYVVDNPLQAVGAALLAGYLLGRISGWRNNGY